ncbi:MAG: hypothetical protein ACYC44_01445 [Patescibacteria group bacterium]
MNVTDFMKAGFRFSYCMDCVMPQIPRVQDVLYALHLSDKCEEYEFMLSNHEPYVTNVHLVAATMCTALCERPRDEQVMRKMIAQAIVSLCPDEARCVLYANDAYVLKEAGMEIPAHDHATCPHCIERHKRDNAHVDDIDDDGSAD